jgi:hypothetical protein
METGRNFAMSGINSGHHNLPTYEISLKSNNVEFVQYCGGHFKNVDIEYEISLKLDNVEFVRYCGVHFENADR